MGATLALLVRWYTARHASLTPRYLAASALLIVASLATFVITTRLATSLNVTGQEMILLTHV